MFNGQNRIVVGVAVGLLAIAGISWAYLHGQSGSSPAESALVMQHEAGLMQSDADKVHDAELSDADKAQEQMAEKGTSAGSMREGHQIPGGDMMGKVGSYEAYAPDKIARAEKGKVVLFFRASWCPSCHALDADIRAHLDAIPAGVSILDIDYDNSQELKQKYGVTYQHTFVQVDKDGTQIAKWSGSPTLSDLISNIK